VTYDNYTSIRVSVDRRIAYVTVDNPPINVETQQMMLELTNFAEQVREDSSVHVVVLQSANREFFMAHGDMSFAVNAGSFAESPPSDGTPSGLNDYQALGELFRKLPQVTIAKVAGRARGGGIELSMALDMRFAAKGLAGFGQPEVLFVFIPGGGGTQYLPPLVGRARALEILLGAQLIDADTAERYGLVNRALPPEELDGFVDTLAGNIAALPAAVIAAVKTAVGMSVAPVSTEALQVESALLMKLLATPHAQERVKGAYARGAQTREGELDLESMLRSF
jgi:enoyl-CoA hydratase/carnithine racemase